MSQCNICNQSVNRNAKDKIDCSRCKNFFHGKCVNLGDTELEQLSSSNWTCAHCEANYRIQRACSDSTPVRGTVPVANSAVGSFVTVENLNSSIADLKTFIEQSNMKMQQDLSVSILACTTKIDECYEALTRQAELIKEQQTAIDRLSEENKCLRKKLDNVELEMDELQQYSRRNNVEIYGVPTTQGENVSKIVLDVCKSVGMDISKHSIDACHRLKKRNNRPTSGIIVKFVRRTDAEDLLLRRKKKRDLNTNHIGFTGEAAPIFINKSLTAKRSKLFAKVKQFQHDAGYKYVWTDFAGRVRIRFREGDRAIVINSEDDLQNLSVSGLGRDE
ncbi:uncharacterized protein LOC111047474 [Nilaparvata lugens]|uniref:uncharacterized protein LOC111047474 n=1 Tax=Nilaparvata lugens TaxID=108931 RepID=UPI000B993591|nr:uncharacterized protein LOC111047474 [Nilaparvata lugens]